MVVPKATPITLLLLSATDAEKRGVLSTWTAHQPLDRLALKLLKSAGIDPKGTRRRRHAPDATVSLKLTRAGPVFVDGLVWSCRETDKAAGKRRQEFLSFDYWPERGLMARKDVSC